MFSSIAHAVLSVFSFSPADALNLDYAHDPLAWLVLAGGACVVAATIELETGIMKMVDKLKSL